MKKLLGIVVFGLLLSGNANAETTSEYLGNNVWIIKYDYNCTYKGSLKGVGKKKGIFKTKQKGVQHGYGVFDCDGGIAEGEFKNGKFFSGTMQTPSGDRYEGQFDSNGKLQGEGTKYYSNGDVWFCKNNQNGVGYGECKAYIKSKKGRYEGNVDKNTGAFTGKVKIYYDNGSIAEGTCDSKGCSTIFVKSIEEIQAKEQEKENKKALYNKIYNKCILENLKGQTDKEAIKIIKDVCKDKAANPSMLDKLLN